MDSKPISDLFKSDLYREMKEEKEQYLKNKILCDLLDKCCYDTTLSAETREKMKRNKLVMKSADYMKINNAKTDNPKRSNLFGLPALRPVPLTPEERMQIQKLVDEKLGKLSQSGAGNSDATDTSPQDKKLLDLYQTLREQMSLYHDNLEIHSEMIEKMVDTRHNELPAIGDLKIEESRLQTNINEIKLKMLMEKMRVEQFLEIPPSTSLMAYEKLMRELENQRVKYEEEIKELLEIKEKYKLVECKEYNEILESYLKYKDAINNMKTAMGIE